jgi:hypothetical protein
MPPYSCVRTTATFSGNLEDGLFVGPLVDIERRCDAHREFAIQSLPAAKSTFRRRARDLQRLGF